MPKIKISSLDRIFSFYIRCRDRWRCQRCGIRYEPPTMSLHCSHFMGRAKKSTRFDPENCQALCYGCHSFLTAHPHEHHRFVLAKLGEKRYHALVLRSNIGGKPDYELIKIWTKRALGKLPLNAHELALAKKNRFLDNA